MTSCFPFEAFKVLSLSLTFGILIICLDVDLFGFILFVTLCFLDLDACALLQFFSHYFFKYVFCPFLSLFSFCNLYDINVSMPDIVLEVP